MTESLRIASFLAPNMLPVYEFIAEHIGRALRCRTQLVVGQSFDQFSAGELDAGFICGLPYVRLASQTPAPVGVVVAPVISGDRYGGCPIYFSDVIVRRDSPLLSFADLRGRSWAYNDLNSHSGYNLTRHQLVRMGEKRGFFGRVVEAGFLQRAVRMAAMGEIDAGAIDSQMLAIEFRDELELAQQLRVIETIGPSTIQPVVAARRLPADLKTSLQAVLLEMTDDPAAKRELARGMIECFVPVVDADYDDIRGTFAESENAGFLSIG